MKHIRDTHSRAAAHNSAFIYQLSCMNFLRSYISLIVCSSSIMFLRVSILMFLSQKLSNLTSERFSNFEQTLISATAPKLSFPDLLLPMYVIFKGLNTPSNTSLNFPFMYNWLSHLVLSIVIMILFQPVNRVLPSYVTKNFIPGVNNATSRALVMSWFPTEATPRNMN